MFYRFEGRELNWIEEIKTQVAETRTRKNRLFLYRVSSGSCRPSPIDNCYYSLINGHE